MEILKRAQSKVQACPGCQKKLRIPIKMGKTLQITCPECRGQFQVNFALSKMGKILPTLAVILLIVFAIQILTFHYSPSYEVPPQSEGMIKN